MMVRHTILRFASGFGSIEGPLWLPDYGMLFSDVIFGGVFALREGAGMTTVVPHRRALVA
ncbi:MAG: hypothetical protein R3E84_08035 [Pseudomonadales bacterium]